MVEQSHTITPSEPEASRRWRYALRDRARIVKHSLDHLSCDLSHTRWLNAIVEQVGDHPTSDGCRKTVQQEPLSFGYLTAV